ncbi:MAG: hypothetical protein GEV11_21165 [Streptosporangiales bacterium]|nr:hypothetical protein [Streptosporangiales bacterium]
MAEKPAVTSDEAYVLRFSRSWPWRWLTLPLWASIPVALAWDRPLLWPLALALIGVLIFEYSDDVRALWYGLRSEVILGVDERGVRLGRDAHGRHPKSTVIPWEKVRAVELSRPPVRRSPHAYACVGVRLDEGPECRWVLSRRLDRERLERAVRAFAPDVPIVERDEGHRH